jgi:5'-methylthioadenosine phosphorylase
VWHETEDPVSVEAVIRILQENTKLAQRAIRTLVPRLAAAERDCECGESLAAAIITQRDLIPGEVKERLGLILGKYLG